MVIIKSSDNFIGNYPVSKQISAWLYLDTRAVHPDILFNTRPFYIEEVKISFEITEVRN